MKNYTKKKIGKLLDNFLKIILWVVFFNFFYLVSLLITTFIGIVKLIQKCVHT